MGLKAWFQSWWWPARIFKLQCQIGRQSVDISYLEYRLQKSDDALRYAEAEATRMREKWLTATRELEHAKEQAVQQKQERLQYILQRDEARSLVCALARTGENKLNLPEWTKTPFYKDGAL